MCCCPTWCCRSMARCVGSVLVFVLSLGFFITPALLGGGRVMMIAVLIEQQVRETLNWPFAAALSFVLLAFTFAVYALEIGRAHVCTPVTIRPRMPSSA